MKKEGKRSIKIGDRVIVHPLLSKDELFVKGYDGLLGTVTGISINTKLKDIPYIVMLDSVAGEYNFAEEELDLISDISKRLIAEKAEKNDVISHPPYYTQGIECMDYIESHKLNYARGNIIKYVTRAGLKDTLKEVEDLEKARWYLDREIERVKAVKEGD
jgi:hypothetical protein